jgi:membrane protein YdbS with pleckstrin-like domain
MSGTISKYEIGPEDREKLIAIFHPKRVQFLFLYVFGAVVLLIGFFYNVLTAAQLLPYQEFIWYLANGAIFFGAALMAVVEARRRLTLYVITTWNARVKSGILKRNTKRTFYDQITCVGISVGPEDKTAEAGDVCIYSVESRNEPEIVFKGIHNPDGIKILLERFVETTGDPPTWNHVPRGPTKQIPSALFPEPSCQSQ